MDFNCHLTCVLISKLLTVDWLAHCGEVHDRTLYNITYTVLNMRSWKEEHVHDRKWAPENTREILMMSRGLELIQSIVQRRSS